MALKHTFPHQTEDQPKKKALRQKIDSAESHGNIIIKLKVRCASRLIWRILADAHRRCNWEEKQKRKRNDFVVRIGNSYAFFGHCCRIELNWIMQVISQTCQRMRIGPLVIGNVSPFKWSQLFEMFHSFVFFSAAHQQFGS